MLSQLHLPARLHAREGAGTGGPGQTLLAPCPHPSSEGPDLLVWLGMGEDDEP